MAMRRISYIVVIAIAVGAAVFLIDWPRQPQDQQTAISLNTNQRIESAQTVDAETLEQSLDHTSSETITRNPEALNRLVEGTGDVLTQVAEAEVRAKRNQPQSEVYKLLGRGASGRIVTQDGTVILKSGPDIMLIDSAESPDQKRILARGGDAIAYVINPEQSSRIQLPSAPPEEGMLGFGGWYWVDDETLIGVSGVQSIDEETGAPVSCCAKHNVERTILYLFDVETETLEAAVSGGGDLPLFFSIAEASRSGHIHLISEDPHEETETDLGWYRFEVNQ